MSVKEITEKQVKVAIEIGKASSIKDWQFTAKHWDKINDNDQLKVQLLNLAKAAISGIVKEGESERQHYFLGNKTRSSKLALGDWGQHKNDAWWGQIVAISVDGRRVSICWTKKKALSEQSIVNYDDSSSGVTDFIRLGPKEERPF